VETAMGVVVYTLIAVFLWPQTNLGAIKKSSVELATTLQDICSACRDTLIGQRAHEAGFAEQQTKVVQQLNRFGQVLQAEGSESYEVHEVRHLWERFHGLSTAYLETSDRLESGFAELARIDLRAVFPELPVFFAELDARFAGIQQALAGRSPGHRSHTVRLEVDAEAFQRLTYFNRAAVAVAKKEMERLEELTAALLECTLELGGQAATSAGEAKSIPAPGLRDRMTRLPVPDWDHLRSAAFVTATTGVGFLIWIFFNPPGHSLWFQVGGTIALMVALIPQLRASKLIMPVAVTSAACLAVYVFVMPQLSSFLGLGSLLFIAMFLSSYFVSGAAQFFCKMAILNMLPIQNHQVYSFAAMANAYIFFLMLFTFLFVMSYLLNSPRPEKAVLRLLDRFFGSAEFLISRRTSEPWRTSSWKRWRIAFHERQLRSLPAKLAAWGKSIDPKLLPHDSPDPIQPLVSSAQTLVYRLDQFLEARAVPQAESLARELRDDITTWQTGIETTFDRWARSPEAEPIAALEQRLEAALTRLEERMKEVVNESGGAVNKEDGENFFRLLGGYRGVSEAALAYAGAAQQIDWAQWREERFS